jgi:SAM-dependent methyltransferase
MDPRQTAASYDQLASHWGREGFMRDNGIEQHARAIRLSRGPGYALDVGCGSSGRIIQLLLSRGYAVEGLDLSTEMLAIAQKKHPQVRFHHADICTWEFPRSYDFISGWDSIWHVPLAQQENLLRKLCAALNPGGILIFTTGVVDTPSEVTNPCQGQPLYHAALGVSATLRLIDQCGCICRHLEQDQFPEKHLYLIFEKL